ncbi:hypothetical protein [Actinomadura rudentiformis]|uniref:Uncharacterized protein n=1 Tax=Actinomadura rudentiformis TaxID=359158 RepID=A0A6H9YI69_9ACTN|nr:hypothetical protein [Actinomadura rudentiformis]KAB2343780.1 hypothetical protein F8566_34285 [Actinomadura rudentiformis]
MTSSTSPAAGRPEPTTMTGTVCADVSSTPPIALTPLTVTSSVPWKPLGLTNHARPARRAVSRSASAVDEAHTEVQ